MDNDELLRTVKLLDKIITSERKEVKTAFQELLLIVALTEDNKLAGPLEQMVDTLQKDVRQMKGRLETLERPSRYDEDWYKRQYLNNPYQYDTVNPRLFGGSSSGVTSTESYNKLKADEIEHAIDELKYSMWGKHKK